MPAPQFAERISDVFEVLTPAMTTDPLQREAAKTLAEASQAIAALESLLPDLCRAASMISSCLQAGGRVFLFGNGGSAAQAQHIAAEFVGRFQAERRPLPAIALTTDTSALTAIANDYGFEEVFARQLRALARPGDVAVAISTSGNSPNVLRGLEQARKMQIRPIGLAGASGGAMASRVELCLCVPASSTPRVQEAHLVIAHLLCQLAEQSFLSGEPRS